MTSLFARQIAVKFFTFDTGNSASYDVTRPVPSDSDSDDMRRRCRRRLSTSSSSSTEGPDEGTSF